MMPNQYLEDRDEWTKFPYAIYLTDSFKTYQEMLAFVLEGDITESRLADFQDMTEDQIEAIRGVTDPNNEKFGHVPLEYSMPNNRDSTFGGNDAINPLPQFCEYDDLIHRMTAIGHYDNERDIAEYGMGRVYNEVYDNFQQIMWVMPGVMRFTELVTFYQNAFDNDLSSIMQEGDGVRIGYLIGRGIRLAVSIALFPIKFFVGFFNWWDRRQISKYYTLEPSFIQYYRIVNSLIANLAVGMGLYPGANDGENLQDHNGNPIIQVGGEDGYYTENITPSQLFDSKDDYSVNEQAIPAIIRSNFDMFRILNRKVWRTSQKRPQGITIDEVAEAMKDGGEVNLYADPEKNKQFRDEFDFITNFTSGFAAGGHDLNMYVPIRIEKTTSSTETLSNSTGPSAIAGSLKSKMQAFQDARFTTMGGSTGIDIVDAAISGVKSLISGATNAVNIDGIFAAMKGTAHFDIPDVWQDSKFTKYYNFQVRLRAPSGDKVSIFQSLYMPLMCLFGLGLPRATGRASFTTPFLLTAYCKGMFAVPLGIIDTFTLTRGRPEHGWTVDRLPTAIDITFTIRDLSPSMYLFATGSALKQFDYSNDGMLDYLDTLSGIGLAERHFQFLRLKRRFRAGLTILKNNVFNSAMVGNYIGSLPPVRFVNSWSSTTPLSNR